MTIDYDHEFDTRAFAKDAVTVLARMSAGAVDYRARGLQNGRAELAIRYGETPRQIIDLFLPDADEAAPVAVFIHGGFWRMREPANFSVLAKGLNARGVTVALPGYDLTPQVTIAQIIEQMRQAMLFLYRRFHRPMLVLGHSAGGHLAACMAATDWAKAGIADDIVPAAMGISGLYELEPLRHTSMNQDFRLDAAQARAGSPLLWTPPVAKRFDAIVGGAESSEFLRQSRVLAEVWGKAGVVTRYTDVPGADHFTVIEPLTDPQSDLVARLLELVPR